MAKENSIKIIQNILKQDKKFSLAVKLEKSYYEDYIIDGWNGGIGEVCLYIDAKFFLEIQSIDEKTKECLISLFNSLPHEYYEINSLKFAISTKEAIENITDTTYIFIDESGDMNFTATGSKYYMFNFLVKKRLFKLH